MEALHSNGEFYVVIPELKYIMTYDILYYIYLIN